jgi:hypothetical protein
MSCICLGNKVGLVLFQYRRPMLGEHLRRNLLYHDLDNSRDLHLHLASPVLLWA